MNSSTFSSLTSAAFRERSVTAPSRMRASSSATRVWIGGRSAGSRRSASPAIPVTSPVRTRNCSWLGFFFDLACKPLLVDQDQDAGNRDRNGREYDQGRPARAGSTGLLRKLIQQLNQGVGVAPGRFAQRCAVGSHEEKSREASDLIGIQEGPVGVRLSAIDEDGDHLGRSFNDP